MTYPAHTIKFEAEQYGCSYYRFSDDKEPDKYGRTTTSQPGIQQGAGTVLYDNEKTGVRVVSWAGQSYWSGMGGRGYFPSRTCVYLRVERGAVTPPIGKPFTAKWYIEIAEWQNKPTKKGGA